ncbi:MAG: hypothetical protein KGZ54_05245 [Dethiobacter sp.]|nr:hypothetical protein [Dethiobacter sp.]MBS3901408.1 hypothetical protein [Dethiobacter sp.]MBS3988658.1 hypothetical protein [Dethiobacter sp.]
MEIKDSPVFESLEEMSREELQNFIKDLCKRWLAHDGLWFQAAEKKFGMEAAIELDEMAWEKFTVVEAKRIMETLSLPENGGLKSLAKALNFRLYAFINKQEILWVNSNQLVFRMNNCRVQVARRRKNLPDFPCKTVGILEYSGFARTIDPRIKTKCITCPPDKHPDEYYCAWEFSLEE